MILRKIQAIKILRDVMQEKYGVHVGLKDAKTVIDLIEDNELEAAWLEGKVSDKELIAYANRQLSRNMQIRRHDWVPRESNLAVTEPVFEEPF